MRVGALVVGDDQDQQAGPRVFGISPAHGAFGGGTAVTITGRGFTGATSAKVGVANLIGFTLVDDGTITGTTPAGTHGYADVQVLGGLAGTLTAVDAYHFDQNPTVTSVVPSHGPIGGQAVEIHGSGFTGMTGAVVGGLATGPDFFVISDIRIDTEVKPHAFGDVDVTVNGLFGETGTLHNGYHYDQPLATFTSITPNHGSTAGGDPVTVVGTNFTTATAVRVGGVALTGMVVVDDNTITGTTGAHAIANVDVEIDNDSGTFVSGPAFDYEFDPASLPLDWWQAPDYPGVGVAWPGTASAGTSGAHSDVASPGALAGAAVNGHVPISIALGDISRANETLDNYITATQFSGAIVFNASVAPPDSGAASRVLNAQLMAAESAVFFGVHFSASGVGTWMLSSFIGYVDNVFACATGVWACLQFKYDGVNLKTRLNGGAWTTQAVASGFNGTNPNTTRWRIGAQTYTAHNPTAQVEEGFLSQALISDANFDNYLAAMRVKYAQPF